MSHDPARRSRHPWQAGRVRALLVTSACLALVVTGCQGGDDTDSDLSSDERLAAAKSSLDDAEYIEFSITTDDLPDGVDGLLDATGTGTHDPAFTGEVHVQTAIAITADLISIGDDVWADMPLVGWTPIDPATYGAPNPADLMDTSSGISTLLTATEDAEEGDSTRDGDEVLTTIDGTIPGDDVQAIFPSAGTDPFDVTYTLTGDDDVSSIEITGPFYGDEDVSYTLSFDLDGDPVDIEPPI